MEVNIIEEYDPLHMPAIIKLEAVEADRVCFEYQFDKTLLPDMVMNLVPKGQVQTWNVSENQLDMNQHHDNLVTGPEIARQDTVQESSVMSEDENSCSNMDVEVPTFHSDSENEEDSTNDVRQSSVIVNHSVSNSSVDTHALEYETNSSENTSTNIKTEVARSVDDKIRCKNCNQTLKNESTLKSHTKKCKKSNKIFVCNLCSYKSDQRSKLSRHINNYHKAIDKCHTCEICQKTFARSDHLKHHLKVHSYSKNEMQCVDTVNNIEKLTCYKCKKTFKDLNSLQNHEKGCNVNKHFFCDLCSLNTYRKDGLTVHISITHNFRSRKYNCKLCKMSYKTKQELATHSLKHGGRIEIKSNDLLPYDKNKNQCQYCKTVLYQENLKIHMLEKHKKNVEYCVRCNFLTECKDEMRYHKTYMHGNSEFKCEFCEKIFDCKNIHKKHMKKIHNQVIFNCNKCKKLFDNSYNYNFHLKYECKIKCTVCEITFTCRNELLNHITETHSNIAVKQVDQLFMKQVSVNIGKNNRLPPTNQNNGNRQISKNHNDKLHVCNTCSFKTVKRSEIIKHIKKYHLYVNVYKCKICNFKTKNYEDLQTHILCLHNGMTVQCQFCTYQAKYQYVLDVHVKSKHAVESKAIEKKANIAKRNKNARCYTCELCKETFTYFKNMKFHIKKHLTCSAGVGRDKKDNKIKNNEDKGKIEFKTCKYCSNKYKTRKQLLVHELRFCKYNKNEYNCDLCIFKIKNKHCLVQHMREKHKFAEYYYKCKKCFKKFYQNCKYKKHSKVCLLTRNLHLCIICKCKISSLRKYKAHIKQSHEKYHVCIPCNEIFNTKSDLCIHNRIQHPVNEKKLNDSIFKCNLCTKTYKRCSSLTKHVKFVHTKDYVPLICDECGKSFQRKGHLKLHKLSLHSDGAELLKCDFCDKKYHTIATKRLHEISNHNRIKDVTDPQYKEILKRQKSDKIAKIDSDLIPELTCQFCGKIATSKCNLRAHIYTVHSTVKPHKCNECDKSYKFKRDLTVHIMTHTNVKPIKCPTCSFATKCISSLKRHILSIHVKT